jgi:hypothetical protein
VKHPTHGIPEWQADESGFETENPTLNKLIVDFFV